jgi:hypothetical protein
MAHTKHLSRNDVLNAYREIRRVPVTGFRQILPIIED